MIPLFYGLSHITGVVRQIIKIFYYWTFLGFGLGLASGSRQKQVFQSLHDIRLVKNLFPPGPLGRGATTKLAKSWATTTFFIHFHD